VSPINGIVYDSVTDGARSDQKTTPTTRDGRQLQRSPGAAKQAVAAAGATRGSRSTQSHRQPRRESLFATSDRCRATK